MKIREIRIYAVEVPFGDTSYKMAEGVTVSSESTAKCGAIVFWVL